VTPTTIILSSILALQFPAFQNDSIEVVLEYKSSVRALEVVDENTIIFSGHGGLIGVSRDSGNTWDTTRVEFEGRHPAFRACSAFEDQMYIASIESPGLIFRIPLDDLNSRELLYKNDNPIVFLDAMAFTDDGIGIVMGDPQNECITIIRSHAQESNWEEIPCESIPEAIKGEAAFAASNGNISIVGEKVWIATGGKASRVFHSCNSGENWSVYNTPVIQGGQMTGAFAISFKDDQTGLLIGGDWEDKSNNFGNICITRNGGKTWDLISEGKGPGYRSSIVWSPTDSNTCVAIGSEGIDISNDEGKNWERVSDDGYYTGRFDVDGKILWLAGHGKLSKLVLNEN
tara:strand:- start:5468 stop:6499 length:1032 start_codon:yes stop_codon:yes gene_type:complete